MVSKGTVRTIPSKRMMVFIDGTNLLVQLGKELGFGKKELRADRPPLSCVILAGEIVKNSIIGKMKNRFSYLDFSLIRSYWFGYYTGDEDIFYSLTESFRENEFEPCLFKKKKGHNEKGVDIALTKEMLINAFNSNFDLALLIAGDEDYLPIVSEIKRYGAQIMGSFFNNGLSQRLKIAFDYFQPIELSILGEKLQQLVENIKKEMKL